MTEREPDLDRALDVALGAARAACGVLNRGARALAAIEQTVKSPGDVSTAIDRRAEAVIRRRLRAAFPDHAFTGEESGCSGDCPCRWIVDPLDGTMNYVHGYPYYAVSLALTVDGRVVLGVVADPVRREVFHAVRGRGAFLNGRPLRVSDIRSMDRALVGTVVPPPRWPGMAEYLKRFNRVAIRAAGMRRAGAAALDLASLAAGRLDAFFVESLKAWDIAAGMLLVTEAGGQVADMTGQGDPLATNRLAAANAWLLPDLLGLMRI